MAPTPPETGTAPGEKVVGEAGDWTDGETPEAIDPAAWCGVPPDMVDAPSVSDAACLPGGVADPPVA